MKCYTLPEAWQPPQSRTFPKKSETSHLASHLSSLQLLFKVRKCAVNADLATMGKKKPRLKKNGFNVPSLNVEERTSVRASAPGGSVQLADAKEKDVIIWRRIRNSDTRARLISSQSRIVAEH